MKYELERERFEQLASIERLKIERALDPADRDTIRVPLLPDDERPSELERRFELMGLIYLAGQCGLEAAHEPIRAIAREAISQRDWVYERQDLDLELRYGWIALRTLYSRQVLAVGLAGTAPGSTATPDILSGVGVGVKSEDLTSYDALVTTYDHITIHGVPPDFSRGKCGSAVYRRDQRRTV